MNKLLVILSLSLCSFSSVAQDFRAAPPLPEFPQHFQTTEYEIQVDLVANGLSNPWSIAFLPDGDMLVTERAGRLRRISNGELAAQPINGVPEVKITVLGGLLDVLLHPDFASNQVLYLSYAKGREEDNLSTTALARASLNGDTLVGLEDIFIANSWSTSPTNFGGRMVFGEDGKLYMTIGERQEETRAQDLMDHGGKVIRLNEDGSVPTDNPFVTRDNVMEEIFALGIRSPQGLALHPDTGELWENEHGPLGGDEINIIQAGKNYGWPLATYGLDYDGFPFSEETEGKGLEQPFLYWIPSIAVSGISFYVGDAFPNWQGNTFVGSMVMGRTPMTGHIQRITFSDEGVPLAREPILVDLHQRIRDVRPGPDGNLYVLTDQNPGAVLRISPTP
ncbi:MAG: PQQ-dependent sugar dehydrogenase [Gammaproteobacteria bacterium]|nr:PQQ-dependent sugar dehydrogenase [Gammaproteobacteria bacterium]